MRPVLWVLATLICGLLLGLLGLLVGKGAGELSLELLFTMPVEAGRAGGMLPVLVSTLLLVAGALAAAVPVGVGAALYLAEYAPDGPLVRWIRSLIEALSGVPSILFGLFGFSLFVIRLGWGWSLAAGSLTLALMLLPTVIRTAEEAVRAVPRELREGAAALGATRWEALRRVVLRQAAPGILTGAVLALGRALGETAAVLLTAGTDLGMPTSLMDPGRTLSVHLYILATEGLSEGRAYAAALILVTAVLAVNLTANLALERWRRP
ncbi:MAG TPA: phosphate ABC transporter permease PstA [Symbiobacteriaceae bacterium]